MKALLAALMLAPTLTSAQDLRVENAMIPLAPPGAMVHAAYLKLRNTGDAPRRLIGVAAKGYHMAHIHLSAQQNGVATMSSVDLVDIGPGQTVTFAHGGLHIMLMKPMARLAPGDAVPLTLEFANAQRVKTTAIVVKMTHGS